MTLVSTSLYENNNRKFHEITKKLILIFFYTYNVNFFAIFYVCIF